MILCTSYKRFTKDSKDSLLSATFCVVPFKPLLTELLQFDDPASSRTCDPAQFRVLDKRNNVRAVVLHAKWNFVCHEINSFELREILEAGTKLQPMFWKGRGRGRRAGGIRLGAFGSDIRRVRAITSALPRKTAHDRKKRSHEHCHGIRTRICRLAGA